MTTAAKNNDEIGDRDQQITDLQLTLRDVIDHLIARADSDSPLMEMPILQVRCLRTISRNEGQKLIDIALVMNASAPGMSRIVERLVKQGLVERQQDPTNRRAVRLWTTQTARNLMEDADRMRHERLEECVRDLSSNEICEMISDLKRLVDAAKQRLPIIQSLPNADTVPVPHILQTSR